MEEIYKECLLIRSKTFLIGRQFQSLLGKLIYLQKVIKLAKIFVNKILSVFRESSQGKKSGLQRIFLWTLTGSSLFYLNIQDTQNF